METLKQKIIDFAKKDGIDLIGFAAKSRFDGLDERLNPFSIFPEAKTVILIAPRLEQLQDIAEGKDQDFLSYLMIRSVLWRKDVRLYLDFEPPRFKRNTFLEGVNSCLDTLKDMGVTVSPYYTGDAAQLIGESLVTEADAPQDCSTLS